MKSIPVLGIPHYNRPDLLERCIKSIDYPVDTLVIVRNGPLEEFPMEFLRNLKKQLNDSHFSRLTALSATSIKKIEIIQHPNAGVAGAWNEIIKLFPAPYWMLANNDIQFTPGDLEKMVIATEQNLERCFGGSNPDSEISPAGKIYGNHGASFFCITTFGVEQVGLFDENIFPAYLEDCDWSYRADLLGVRRITIPDIHAIHGDGRMSGSCTVNSDAELREKNSCTHENNFAYYERKWGGRNEQEKFTTPFNHPNLPVDYWKFEPALRAKNQW